MPTVERGGEMCVAHNLHVVSFSRPMHDPSRAELELCARGPAKECVRFAGCIFLAVLQAPGARKLASRIVASVCFFVLCSGASPRRDGGCYFVILEKNTDRHYCFCLAHLFCSSSFAPLSETVSSSTQQSIRRAWQSRHVDKINPYI